MRLTALFVQWSQSDIYKNRRRVLGRVLLGSTSNFISALLFVNRLQTLPPFHNTVNNCLEVDELILDLIDYKNDYADMAAVKLLKKCSTSWEAFKYPQDRVHDAWLPDSARQQVRQIIMRIQVQLHQRREYGWAYEPV